MSWLLLSLDRAEVYSLHDELLDMRRRYWRDRKVPWNLHDTVAG